MYAWSIEKVYIKRPVKSLNSEKGIASQRNIIGIQNSEIALLTRNEAQYMEKKRKKESTYPNAFEIVSKIFFGIKSWKEEK